MPNHRTIYESFIFRSDAEALQELLLKNGVICVLDFPEGFFDFSWSPTLDKKTTVKYYCIMLDPADFAKSDQIQNEKYKALQTELDIDYPLYHFTDLELFDVLEKFESWSKFDYFMACQILEERGLPVDEATLKSFKDKRLDELEKPERATKRQLFQAYLLLLLFGLGGLYGLEFRDSKLVPSGRMVSVYDGYSRRHGLVIGVLGLVYFLGSCFVLVKIVF